MFLNQFLDELSVNDPNLPRRCSIFQCWGVCAGGFYVCEEHLAEIGKAFVDERSIWGTRFLAARRERIDADAVCQSDSNAARDRRRSVVYYVRLADHVKIGYTTHLRGRLGGLRTDATALLAAEPGWREVEAQRHAEFADERQGRRENFNPSRRLLAHIDQVLELHGDPLSLASSLARSALRESP